MCGIAGVITFNGSDAAVSVLQSLKLQEYRGYDGAGVAYQLQGSDVLHRLRRVGKTGIADLGHALSKSEFQGANKAIGHTRWATKGIVEERNCHPHTGSKEQVMLVHNGTITNEAKLRLLFEGVSFSSDTDSELLAYDLERRFDQSPLEGVIDAVAHWQGAFALIILRKDDPDAMWLVRRESPLMVGRSETAFSVASSFAGFSDSTQNAWPMPESSIVRLTNQGQLQAWTFSGDMIPEAEIVFASYESDYDDGTNGGLPHRTLREIFEQPQRWECLSESIQNIQYPDLQGIKAIEFVACGSSLHAALVCAQAFRRVYQVPVTCFEANEYEPFNMSNTLTIAISQSGETADVLAAMRSALIAKRHIGCLVNSTSSTLELLVKKYNGFALRTYAGVERAVASTKAFTCQIVALQMMVLQAQKQDAQALSRRTFLAMNQWLEDQSSHDWDSRARMFLHPKGSFFLGHGALYPVALEGALKLKEIAYVPAMAEPAGGIKHGPLALVEPGFPIAFLIHDDQDAPLLRDHIDQLRSRSGDHPNIWVITDSQSIASEYPDATLVPKVDSAFTALAFTLPLQFMAYHAAVLAGHDPDQPRNLAKSVTVR